jgi:hypothetical protein
MTFDFSPDWLLQAVAATEFTGAAPKSVVTSPLALSPLAAPPPCAPSHPSVAELANLVTELFAEGTLSWEQLRAMGMMPELRPLLAEAIAATPAARRIAPRDHRS